MTTADVRVRRARPAAAREIARLNDTVSAEGQMRRRSPEAIALAIGHARVGRARYPEKIRRDCLGSARRFACNEHCCAKRLEAGSLVWAA